LASLFMCLISVNKKIV